jgi:hypothetical protein
MRRSVLSRPVIAGLLVVAMMLSLTGLLGAAGTSIRITSPVSGAHVSGIVKVQASIRSDVRISYVILGVDNDRPQSSNSAPYSFQIDTRELADGAHRVFVEAYDRYGLVGRSSVTTLYVRNGSSPARQVKKEPATRVASRPSAPAVSTAKAEPKPPARAVAARDVAPARTIPSPAASSDQAAASPVVSGRGPLPAPTQSVAEPAIAAARPAAPSTPARKSVASPPIGSRPPAPQIAASRVRGHTVLLNGRAVEFDVAPRIVKGRMHAPFRSMFESQGARVTWDSENKTARSVKGALTVEVPIGERMAMVNGAPVDMGANASIRKGRTIVPVRFFGEAVGANVHWDSATRTAMVQMRDRQIAERPAQD